MSKKLILLIFALVGVGLFINTVTHSPHKGDPKDRQMVNHTAPAIHPATVKEPGNAASSQDWLIQPGQQMWIYGIAVLAGIGLSAAYLIPWAMLPDTIEYNEVKTGERQEGLFYGFFVFLQKLGLSLGLGISGWVLGAAGYLTPAVEGGALQLVSQPDEVLLALRLFVSLIPAGVLVISIPLALAYPITRHKHDEMCAELAARRAAATI